MNPTAIPPKSKLATWPAFSMLCLAFAANHPSAVQAAAGPGGVVQGVLNFPDFKSGPTGVISDLDQDGTGNTYPFPPYVPIVNSPFATVDDAVDSPGIPGVSVYIKNKQTNVATAPQITDSWGGFVFPSQPAGTYVLCWQNGMPGLPSGCSTETFEVIDHAASRWVANLGGSPIVDWTPIDAPAPSNLLTVEGYVSAPGLPTPYAPNLNTACVHNDPFFNLDETATVELRDSNNAVLASVKANILGRFMLSVNAPNVPTNYVLAASCGANSMSSPIALASPDRVYKELTLPTNTPPTIKSFKAAKKPSGAALAGAPEGADIVGVVNAVDNDGDNLKYRWRATAGTVDPSGKTAVWHLPNKGKGLHFLYVDVDDRKGGHRSERVAISTDAGFVKAAPLVVAPVQPANHYTESDRFLTYRGIDTRKSACQYYKTIGAAQDCKPNGQLVGGIKFKEWLDKFGLSKPPTPYTDTPPLNPGELHAQFRNVADLNLVRNHHGRNAGKDPNGQDKVAYYVCNHGKASGAVPDSNLVACVSMEYSATPGQNDGKPFTKFLTFGPTGALIPSVNLDGRGEKFTPGNCVPCHGGDNYFQHFPEQGAGAHDGNIGAYFIPFDLDNYEYQAPYTRIAQEDAVRGLNLGLKTGEMTTSAALEIIDGWYPGGIGAQQSEYLPKGWDPVKSPGVPVAGQPKPNDDNNKPLPPYRFNGADLYTKVVKPSCRGCHLTMGPELGLDFHSYDYDGTPGDFIKGHAVVHRTQNNDRHTNDVVCMKYTAGLPTFNFVEDLNSPAKTMPNAVQTFNRYWNDPVQTDLMQKYLSDRDEINTSANPPCAGPGT